MSPPLFLPDVPTTSIVLFAWGSTVLLTRGSNLRCTLSHSGEQNHKFSGSRAVASDMCVCVRFSSHPCTRARVLCRLCILQVLGTCSRCTTARRDVDHAPHECSGSCMTSILRSSQAQTLLRCHLVHTPDRFLQRSYIHPVRTSSQPVTIFQSIKKQFQVYSQGFCLRVIAHCARRRNVLTLTKTSRMNS